MVKVNDMSFHIPAEIDIELILYYRHVKLKYHTLFQHVTEGLIGLKLDWMNWALRVCALG